MNSLKVNGQRGQCYLTKRERIKEAKAKLLLARSSGRDENYITLLERYIRNLQAR